MMKFAQKKEKKKKRKKSKKLFTIYNSMAARITQITPGISNWCDLQHGDWSDQRAIADRWRRAWQAAVAVPVADVTGLATGNGGRQAGGERGRVGGRWALGALGDVGIK